jgi:hypothetical protein
VLIFLILISNNHLQLPLSSNFFLKKRTQSLPISNFTVLCLTHAIFGQIYPGEEVLFFFSGKVYADFTKLRILSR